MLYRVHTAHTETLHYNVQHYYTLHLLACMHRSGHVPFDPLVAAQALTQRMGGLSQLASYAAAAATAAVAATAGGGSSSGTVSPRGSGGTLTTISCTIKCSSQGDCKLSILAVVVAQFAIVSSRCRPTVNLNMLTVSCAVYDLACSVRLSMQ
jgi:hypothetical protein